MSLKMAFSNTLVLCFFLAITMALPTLATDHVVGDALGWTVGPDYTTWASDTTFVVGDSLVFNYGAGWHTVDEVRESDYKSCTTRNSISTDDSGATTIPIKEVGTHYFICSVAGHCTSGMKLSVNVKASSASAPSATPSGKSSPSNSTPDTITTAPSTNTITTPTMQNASSTSSVSPIGALFFVVILISYILV